MQKYLKAFPPPPPQEDSCEGIADNTRGSGGGIGINSGGASESYQTTTSHQSSNTSFSPAVPPELERRETIVKWEKS